MEDKLNLMGFLEKIKTGEHCWADDDLASWVNELNDLQAENEKLRTIITDLLFAYVNKDTPPHQFETEAVAKAEQALKGGE